VDFRLRGQNLVALCGVQVLLSGLQAEKGWTCPVLRIICLALGVFLFIQTTGEKFSPPV